MRTAYALCLVLAAVIAGGCIPSYPVAQGELDEVWRLTEGLSSDSPWRRPTVAGQKLPSRWFIRQHPSVIWSTVSIVRAVDELETEPDQISFSVSPTHTQTVVDLLDRASEMLEGLGEIAEVAETNQSAEWSELMAEALIRAEQISRAVSLDAAELHAETGQEGGIAAEPLLRMLALYINEGAGGELLAELDPNEINRIRSVLMQVALQLGFDLASRQLPPDLRQRVDTLMQGVDRLADVQESLQDLLAEAADQAPPAPAETKTSRIIKLVSGWGPKGIKFIQTFVVQWDRMEGIDLDFRFHGDVPVMTATVHVQPGKEVRLADAVIFQPTMIFRGSSRITIIPELPETNETVVLFEPIDGGDVEMRFEGLAYSMARAFAFPLDHGALREIRVFTHSAKPGQRVVNVAMLMEATDDTEDPRRMLVFQDVRQTELVRSAFDVETVETRTEQVVSYLSPTRRHTYRRVKTPADD